MTGQNYRDLVVWQKAIALVVDIYKITETFPKVQQYILSQQIQRCAISVPSNIAEGRSRHSENDVIYHLNIAQGSLAELETQLIIAKELHYLPNEPFEGLFERCEEIMRMLQALKASIKTPKAVTRNLQPVT